MTSIDILAWPVIPQQNNNNNKKEMNNNNNSEYLNNDNPNQKNNNKNDGKNNNKNNNVDESNNNKNKSEDHRLSNWFFSKNWISMDGKIHLSTHTNKHTFTPIHAPSHPSVNTDKYLNTYRNIHTYKGRYMNRDTYILMHKKRNVKSYPHKQKKAYKHIEKSTYSHTHKNTESQLEPNTHHYLRLLMQRNTQIQTNIQPYIHKNTRFNKYQNFFEKFGYLVKKFRKNELKNVSEYNKNNNNNNGIPIKKENINNNKPKHQRHKTRDVNSFPVSDKTSNSIEDNSFNVHVDWLTSKSKLNPHWLDLNNSTFKCLRHNVPNQSSDSAVVTLLCTVLQDWWVFIVYLICFF